MNLREPSPLPFEVVAYSTQLAFVWDREWHASPGVPHVDFNLDVRNIFAPSAGISLKPALQFAATRTDRPDTPSLVTGTAITADNFAHYIASFSSATDKFYFRRGVGYQLTSGTFARAQGLLHMAFRSLGQVLPAEEIVFNPTNDTAEPSYFPLGGGRAIPTSGVDKAKLVVFGSGNLNDKLEWRIAARAFNDPFARGNWNVLENNSNWNPTQAGSIDENTGEIPLTEITPNQFQWLELALAVRKAAGTDANSRCIFRVIPALTYL